MPTLTLGGDPPATILTYEHGGVLEIFGCRPDAISGVSVRVPLQWVNIAADKPDRQGRRKVTVSRAGAPQSGIPPYFEVDDADFASLSQVLRDGVASGRATS